MTTNSLSTNYICSHGEAPKQTTTYSNGETVCCLAFTTYLASQSRAVCNCCFAEVSK